MSRVIESYSSDFYMKVFHMESVSTTEFPEALKKELCKFYSTIDKLEFLSHFRSLVNNGYEKHLPKCTNPPLCVKNKAFENALYFIQQESDYIEDKGEKDKRRQEFGTYIGEINISGGNPFVNIGRIKDTIINNSQQLQTAGFGDISENIRALTRIIEEAVAIPDQDKEELLDNIKFLSEQALLEKPNRTSKSVLTSVIKGVFTSLNVLSSISTITDQHLKDITDYFLS